MRCDLHVHTWYSGRCTVPVVGLLSRECYSQPEEVYERLKGLGMDLVTVTDHDSMEAAEKLGGRPDFFASEEVSCTTPSGTRLHVGVYDITERHHVEIQRRRDDLPRLAAYLEEQRLFSSTNHIFSGLTGRRLLADFQEVEARFPALEVLNGHVPAESNRQAGRLAGAMGKVVLGGSDGHTLESVGAAYTEAPGARNREEFLEALRLGRVHVWGGSGGYWKLTGEVLSIVRSMAQENPAVIPLLPLAAGVPAVTLAIYLRDKAFAWRWRRALEAAGRLPKEAGWSARTRSGEAAA
jgi:predicted metal-dependent phosphoesterase TrpH